MSLLHLLFNNSFRKIKFFVSLLILLFFSYYSYNHGKNELSLNKSVRSPSNKISHFPYLKVIRYKNSDVVFEDQWKDYWNVTWPSNKELPKIGMLISFSGYYVNQNSINNIENIILHKGYKIKLYISIFAFMLLLVNKMADKSPAPISSINAI